MKQLMALFAALALLQGTSHAEDVTVASFLSQSRRLNMSPSGTFIYNPEVKRDTWKFNYIPMGCAEKIICELRQVTYPGTFPYSGYIFDAHDQYVLFLGHTKGGGRKASGNVQVQHVPLCRKNPCKEAATAWSPLNLVDPALLLGNITIAGDAGQVEGTSNLFSSVSDILSTASQYMGEKKAPSYGMVFGYIDRNKYFLVSRDEKFDLYVHTNSIKSHLISHDGQAISLDYHQPFPQLNYPVFKRHGEQNFMLASGTALEINQTGILQNVSAKEGRVNFINGDSNVEYYGYFSNNKIYAPHLGKELIDQISSAIAANHIDFLTGVYVSRKRNEFILSFKQTLSPDGGYSHVARMNGRFVQMARAGEKEFTLDRHPIGGGAWIDSYATSKSAPIVVYLAGGPGTHEDIENNSLIAFLLKNQLNVDVVNLGGSDYTYELSGRINRLGLKAFEADAASINSYIATHYSSDRQIVFLVQSFGAHVFLRMHPKPGGGIAGAILEYPSGTISPDVYRMNPDETAKFKKIVGENLFAEGVDNNYLTKITECPFSIDVTIFFDPNDPMVFPEKDYASCLGKNNVRFLSSNAGHEALITDPKVADEMLAHRSDVLNSIKQLLN